MTYTALCRYTSYQAYLDDEQLPPEKNYRLLSTGEAIEVPGEDDGNLWLASFLFAALLKIKGYSFFEFIRVGNKELQVNPVGDQRINRKPDLLVMQPEHLAEAKQAIKLGMSAPAFVAEVVSPGKEESDNYLRDYVWKRQQYQDWQIPEYWIIDPHREKVTVLTLVDEVYQEVVYSGESKIVCTAFPALVLTAEQIFAGEV